MFHRSTVDAVGNSPCSKVPACSRPYPVSRVPTHRFWVAHVQRPPPLERWCPRWGASRRLHVSVLCLRGAVAEAGVVIAHTCGLWAHAWGGKSRSWSGRHTRLRLQTGGKYSLRPLTTRGCLTTVRMFLLSIFKLRNPVCLLQGICYTHLPVYRCYDIDPTLPC